MSEIGSKFSAAHVYPVLAVDDVKRAASFYRDKLGLEVEVDSESYARVHAGNGWVTLYKTSSPRGQNTLAAFVVEDVEGTVEYLRQRGVTFEEYDFPGLKTVNGIALESGMKVAWFKDTEGNTLSIAEGLEAPKDKSA
jgi:catechol 2,3-dioxygenase-like lactoylglutathione lyase family enzyme